MEPSVASADSGNWNGMFVWHSLCMTSWKHLVQHHQKINIFSAKLKSKCQQLVLPFLNRNKWTIFFNKGNAAAAMHHPGHQVQSIKRIASSDIEDPTHSGKLTPITSFASQLIVVCCWLWKFRILTTLDPHALVIKWGAKQLGGLSSFCGPNWVQLGLNPHLLLVC